MQHIDSESLIKKNQTECPCCGGLPATIVGLPQYPLTEFFREASEVGDPYGFVDQELLFCPACNHLFLKTVLDAQQIYSHYLTSSISSRGAEVCIENFVTFIKTFTGDLTPFTIIDIGGNDSTLLEFFIGRSANLINIDPNASTASQSIEIRKTFLENVDFSDFKECLPKIFVSSHAIEHLEDPVALVNNLSNVMQQNDMLYIQFPSLEKLVEQKRFDQICHQHLNYFSLNSISRVLEREGLYVNEFEFDSSHFGTLRLKATKERSRNLRQNFLSSSFLSESFNDFKKYYASLNALLCETFENGQGFGAGLMVPTLAYHLPLINELSKIIDENPSRLGKRFINLDPQILGIDHLDLGSPVLITSISTKDAGRTIFSKLVSLGIRDICLPATVI